jgi:hypothetical protein
MMLDVRDGHGRDPLQLDRSAGGHHRRGDQRDHMAGAGGHGAYGHDSSRTGARGGTAGARNCAGAGGGATTTRAAHSEQFGNDTDRTEGGQ